jgi:hypothetical protein
MDTQTQPSVLKFMLLHWELIDLKRDVGYDTYARAAEQRRRRLCVPTSSSNGNKSRSASM